ncbi:MAG: cell division protein ZipA, partial [Lysobacteraceae bacterium]
ERGIAADDPAPSPSRSTLGARPEAAFDRIVTLYLAARAGESLHGPDIVVACEKAGLAFGHMDIFHRLDDQHPERGPIFSLANLVKPGSFDMARLGEIRTPGVSLFMTLPGPLPALDAWETLLPAAQRMAELLDAVLLDEERNALGRQRIAHLREEMRNYDRKRDAQNIRFCRPSPTRRGAPGRGGHERHSRPHRRAPAPDRRCRPCELPARRPDRPGRRVRPLDARAARTRGGTA